MPFPALELKACSLREELFPSEPSPRSVRQVLERQV